MAWRAKPMSKRFEGMKNNPLNDWRIGDIEALCREFGIRCSPPSGGGAHYKVSHDSQREILTIPARRPIKAVYIKKLVRLVEAVEDAKKEAEKRALDAIQAALQIKEEPSERSE
jgi:hypothetical protein